MQDDRVEELLTIHTGGADTSDARWRAVEGSLGLILPGSYKRLVDRFGASCWRNFLYVLSPFDDARLNLQTRGNQILDADRETRKRIPSLYPIGLYPEPGGLLPWAITDNGDSLYFITAGPPDQWPIVIKGPRAPEFEVSFLPPALLVHHVAAGSFRSLII